MPAATSEFLGEVDEPFDLGHQAPVEVLPRRHLRKDGAPDRGDVGLVGVRPAEACAGPLLPVLALGHIRPRRDAERGGLHRLPDVDVRVAGDEHVRAEAPGTYLVDESRLLAARYEVVDEHAQSPLGVRSELLHDGGQVVDTAEVLDRDPHVAQVVTPHLLDELGVVTALDVDAGRDGDPGCRGLSDPRPVSYTHLTLP